MVKTFIELKLKYPFAKFVTVMKRYKDTSEIIFFRYSDFKRMIKDEHSFDEFRYLYFIDCKKNEIPIQTNLNIYKTLNIKFFSVDPDGVNIYYQLSIKDFLKYRPDQYKKNRLSCLPLNKIMTKLIIKDINFDSRRFTLIDKIHRNYDVSLYAVSRQGYMLYYVDPKLQDTLMVQIAVLDNPKMLSSVRDDLKNEKLISMSKFKREKRNEMLYYLIKFNGIYRIGKF